MLQLILLGPLDAANDKFPTVPLSVKVDDVGLVRWGAEQRVVSDSVGAGELLHLKKSAMDLRFAIDKSCMIGN